MSGNSDVPSTLLCDDRICSIRVEPARGMPTMKIGSRASHPPGRGERVRGKGADAPIDDLA